MNPASRAIRRRRPLAGVAALLLSAVSAAAAGRPNLVFVFADQLSADMLGCYGSPDARTPNLDRLAAAGVRFNHGVSNSPVCTPYRAMLLSGQHVLNVGAFDNDIQMLPDRGPYLPALLRDAGYRTGYFGKWHLHGGDRNRGIPPGPLRYGFDDEFLSNNCTLLFDREQAYYWDQDGTTRRMYGDWEPYAQTRQAEEFIARHAARPFALFLSWHPPHNAGTAHAGYDAPADLLGLYDRNRLTLRPTVQDSPRVREMYHGYLANVSGLDRAMGWLLDALERHGLAENTIVVFTADHGDLLSSYDQPNRKARPEAPSCRVPLLVRWPAALRPAVSDLLIGTLDLMPTLLGLLDLPVPAVCQGRNAAAAVREGRGDGVDALPLFFLPLNWRGVYTARYTYAEALEPPSAAELAKGVYAGGRPRTFNVLYDRQEDPAETRNLFDAPEVAGVRRQLRARTLELMAGLGDRGATREELMRHSLRPDDRAHFALPPDRRPAGWEGRLQGRPVDLVAGLPLHPAVQAEAPTGSGDWIQPAVDRRPGQRIFVPAGDHLVSAPIRLQTDGTGLWGPGRIIATNPDAAIIEIAGASDVQVRDLTLTRPEGRRETRHAAVSVQRSREVVLAGLRVRENQTSRSAIEVRDCAGITVRDCLVENYCRIDIDDRRRTDRHRDYSNYGYAFTCITGNGLMVSTSTGVAITGNRILEHRLRPTPEIRDRYRLGKFVAKDPEKGRLVPQKVWDEEYVNNWNQSRAMGVTSPDVTDGAQIIGNHFEDAGQGTDVHADHVILAHNIVNNSHIGMKAMHGSRNVLVLGNQYVKSDLWSVGLMPGTASRAARPGDGRPAGPNVDGHSIIAHNIVADFGRGHAGWIWRDTAELAPFRFDASPLPENPPLRGVLVTGNIIEDSERLRLPAGAPPRYRRPVRIATGAGAPVDLVIADNLFESGSSAPPTSTALPQKTP